MSREYFNLWYRIDNNDAHLIWYTDERDGIVVDSDGKIPGFRDTDDLLEYAKGKTLQVDAEGAILHDLDVLVEWLKQKESERVDCNNLLAAWNLFEDVSHSVDGGFDPDRDVTKEIYEKLFWGNNLSSVT